MPMPELPDWMRWRVTRVDDGWLEVALEQRPDCLLSVQVVHISDAGEESEIISRVEHAAHRLHHEWNYIKRIDDIIERNWPHVEIR
jgi:hypothetical protein